MTGLGRHRVKFRVDAPVDDLDEVLGVAATRLDPAGQPSIWSVTGRDAAELHGILGRMRSAGFALISVDVLE